MLPWTLLKWNTFDSFPAIALADVETPGIVFFGHLHYNLTNKDVIFQHFYFNVTYVK